MFLFLSFSRFSTEKELERPVEIHVIIKLSKSLGILLTSHDTVLTIGATIKE